VTRQRGRTVEVESLAEFDQRVADGAQAMAGWHLQNVDLRERGPVLRRLDPTGALFLGCGLAEVDEQSLRPRRAGLPGGARRPGQPVPRAPVHAA
jgi:hypothetical protein